MKIYLIIFLIIQIASNKNKTKGLSKENGKEIKTK